MELMVDLSSKISPHRLDLLYEVPHDAIRDPTMSLRTQVSSQIVGYALTLMVNCSYTPCTPQHLPDHLKYLS